MIQSRIYINIRNIAMSHKVEVVISSDQTTVVPVRRFEDLERIFCNSTMTNS